ncbi:MAG: hypothetical protein IPH32_06445 [Bacteroidetes bacterium]|nr:hypothetical protein [Bacteroidota bacterium]
MNIKLFIYGATLALLNINVGLAKTKVTLQKAFEKNILQPKLFVKVV